MNIAWDDSVVRQLTARWHAPMALRPCIYRLLEPSPVAYRAAHLNPSSLPQQGAWHDPVSVLEKPLLGPDGVVMLPRKSCTRLPSRHCCCRLPSDQQARAVRIVAVALPASSPSPSPTPTLWPRDTGHPHRACCPPIQTWMNIISICNNPARMMRLLRCAYIASS